MSLVWNTYRGKSTADELKAHALKLSVPTDGPTLTVVPDPVAAAS